MVHDKRATTPTEVTETAWQAKIRQVRTISERKTREVRVALWQCLSVLTNTVQAIAHAEWAEARLYFDGGGRGIPGSSGSGWALVVRDKKIQWRLDACQYIYQDPSLTSNYRPERVNRTWKIL